MNKKYFISVLFLLTILPLLQSFCGFYVAMGNKKIFNQASEVILVRDGNKNTITMANDFQGDAKDFAMVIPVPTLLKREDIKLVKKTVFEKLNSYSEPRLVEYFDESPCGNGFGKLKKYNIEETKISMIGGNYGSDLGVNVEAKYEIGEYDILILSAKESSGLKTWLKINQYTIPDKAEEVIDPYIKQNMKFFVVKTNAEMLKKLNKTELDPIQISFESEKFMLPIRLGMANAKNTQDLIIYAFTKKGRVECTNYRTVKIPTDKNVPTFIKNMFHDFYKDTFTKTYELNNKNAVFLEYAWDLSSSNYTKCDPCSTTPPNYSELEEAGIFFVEPQKLVHSSGSMGSNYKGDIFFTRLHVRYDRKNFPMDLMFQETPNKESFQGRYIINNTAAVGVKQCSKATKYWEGVLDRREKELATMTELCGWDSDLHQDYVDEVNSLLGKKQDNKKSVFFYLVNKMSKKDNFLIILLPLFIILVILVGYFKKHSSKVKAYDKK